MKIKRAEVAQRSSREASSRSRSCSFTPTERRTRTPHARDLAGSQPRLVPNGVHEVSREQREYERISTTVANAYVGPRVSSYVSNGSKTRLAATRAFAGSLLIMQSSGGLFDVADRARQCIQMLESGPAAGVVGVEDARPTLRRSRPDLLRHGRDDGESVRAAGRDGAVCRPTSSSAATTRVWRSAFPCSTSKRSVPAAAASPWIDEGGGLHVGPKAPARAPGRHATDGRHAPTVTDAHFVLGHLSPSRFTDGRMQSTAAAAERAHSNAPRRPLGIDVPAAAAGILAIATAQMANARAQRDDRTRFGSARLRARRVRRRRSDARRRRRARTRDPRR